MQRWVDLMAWHAGQPQVSFSDTFFEWLNCHELVYAECQYAGMDFPGDPNLVLPAGDQWSAIGKISDHIPVYCFYNVLVLSFIKTNQDSCAHADIGLVWLAVRLRAPAVVPATEAVGRVVLRDLDVAETLAALQDQIKGLTLGIPDVRTDELPLRLQRHATGVPHRWTRFLRMIAQAMTCYHQHH